MRALRDAINARNKTKARKRSEGRVLDFAMYVKTSSWNSRIHYVRPEHCNICSASVSLRCFAVYEAGRVRWSEDNVVGPFNPCFPYPAHLLLLSTVRQVCDSCHHVYRVHLLHRPQQLRYWHLMYVRFFYDPQSVSHHFLSRSWSRASFLGTDSYFAACLLTHSICAYEMYGV